MVLLADPQADTASIPMPRVGEEPPTRLLAFKWGDNATTKGTLKLTREGAAKAMARYRTRGVVLSFDYFHSTYNPQAIGDQKKGAGPCRLEFTEAGAEYVDIRWTPQAYAEIKAGAWPYFSPAVIHDKNGVIEQFLNPGLVTDPGTINARPLLLSHESRIDMDKKRSFMDAYAACESATKKVRAMADGDAELSNKCMAHLSAAMELLSSAGQGNGYMEEAARAAQLSEGRDALFVRLSAEHGEEDPAKLEAKLQAKLDRVALPAAAPLSPDGVLLSNADAAACSQLLRAGHATRIPAARAAKFGDMTLSQQITYLNASSDITPAAAPAERAPQAPSSHEVKRTVDATPKPANADPKKPTTLADCSPSQREFIAGQLAMDRQIYGEKFDERLSTDRALAELSSVEENPNPEKIRHLPAYQDRAVTVVTGV